MLGGDYCPDAVCTPGSRADRLTAAYMAERDAQLRAQHDAHRAEENRAAEVERLLSQYEWQQQRGDEVNIYDN